jgi:hypothetical protein
MGKSLGLIGAGSGHILKGGTAADGLTPSSSIFATTTVTDGWSWRSAISDAVMWSTSPVIFQGGLPRDERSAAALFVLAATSSKPIPVIALLDVLRLRRGLCQALPPEPIHTGCNGSLAAPAGPNGR